jgi:hypothetical protein
MPQTRTYTFEKCEPLYPVQGGSRALAFMPGLTIEAGTVLGQVSGASANEVQTINFSGGGDAPTGGTFTLSIAGIDGGTYTSSALAYNITNANLKIAIDALLASAGYDGATVTIGGGPSPADATVTFGGTAAAWNMPLMTATSSLTAGVGATPTVQVDATTAGNKIGLWGSYDDSANDGRQVAKAIAQYSFRTDNKGRVVFAASGVSPEHGEYCTTAPAWFKGSFKTTDLTGLDDNGVADLGRLSSGTTADGVLELI